MIDIETAFRVLSRAQVEFIVVGGVAARAHGSARLTNDLDLDRLIEVKRAAGRPKDLEAIAELEALLEERQRPDQG